LALKYSATVPPPGNSKIPVSVESQRVTAMSLNLPAKLLQPLGKKSADAVSSIFFNVRGCES
jgi:hypothetical protein